MITNLFIFIGHFVRKNNIKMKRLFSTVTLVFLVLGVNAQLWQTNIIPMPVPPPNYETKLNGYDIQETNDGNYVFAGNFKRGISPNFSYAPTLVKLNATTGAVMWTKVYSVYNDGYMQEVSLVEKPNGNLLLAGLEYNGIFLIETDAMGDTISTHRIISACESAMSSYCTVRSVRLRPTFDGNYILGIGGGAGMIGIPQPLSQLIKISPSNSILWNKIYHNKFVVDVQPTSDGGYIMSGSSLSASAVAFKVDMNGDSIWQQTYTVSMVENINSIKETTDNGYVITYDQVGFAGISPYLMKVDSNGANVLWQTPLGVARGTVYYVILDGSGNYVVTGKRYVLHGGGALQELQVAFMMKISPSGAILQDQVFDDLIDNEGKAIRYTSDGNFVMAGSHAYTFGGAIEKGYVVKTGYWLNTSTVEKEIVNIQVSPNPMEEETTVWLGDNDYLELQVQVFDALGRQVHQVKDENATSLTIHRNNLEAGIYFFKLLGDRELIGSGKIVVK
jgi:hypothetical protein